MANKQKGQPPQPDALKEAAPVEAAVPVEESAEQAAPEEVSEPVPEAEVTLEALQAEVEETRAAAEAAREQALRAAAEVQNARRRAEQDVQKAHKFALDKFTGELLPVVDSLERAVDAAQGDDPSLVAIREGVEMTLNMFMGALKKFKIEPIDPAGEPFDPQLHQAMSMVDNPNVEPNTVIHVMQKGYLLNERLVRPAMVMVSKAAGTPKIDEKA